MFRTQRNVAAMEQRVDTNPPSERELAAFASRRLGELLPSSWTLASARSRRGEDLALLIGAPDGRSARLTVEAKAMVDARSVPDIATRFADASDGDAAVVARYLSPRTRAALEGASLSYLDTTGNVRVVLDEPGLALIATGADRDPFRGPDRPTSSLRGAPAGRVARALIDRRAPWRMRELASFAETSLGSTARTVELLDREGLLGRGEDGGVKEVDWVGVLRRWSEDYELTMRRRVTRALLARGVEAVGDGLRGRSVSYAITGSLAARLASPVAAAELAIVYAQDTEKLLSALGAKPTSGATNLLVIEPSEGTPFLRAFEREGLRYAAYSQIAVDLLAGPGRDPEEGDALIAWMVANEDQWRT